MNCSTKPQTAQCKAMFAKLTELKKRKERMEKEGFNLKKLKNKKKKSKAIAGVPSMPSKQSLNGVGVGFLLGAGVMLLGVGFGGVFGYRYLKDREIAKIISEQEKANNAKMAEADTKELSKRLKKELNLLELRQLRKALQEVQKGNQISEKDKKIFEKAQIPLQVA